jgi:peptidoglycan/LPS O-acetylase OafA/YrhL
MNSSSKYRKEIDGLRALAVVPVILFHAGLKGFSGGYVGVDVFFVISGYLITSLIASELEAGEFSLLKFYERRIRRIFPALFMVTMCCLPLALYWMFPSQLKVFSNSLVSVFYLGSNFWLSQKTGYFETNTGEYPLLHTWSLAAEEQFYLLFPILVMLSWRLGTRKLMASMFILAALSFCIAEWGVRNYPSANFYLLPGRAWELLIGSLAALYLQYSKQPELKFCNIFSVIGLLLVIVSVFAYDADTPFPGIYAIAPTFGTVLIILFASDGTAVNKLLSMPPLVGVGLISYSAYLWHQPLFAFLRIQSLNEPSTAAYFALIIATFLLAGLTWFFVEQPFRRKANFSQRTVYSGFLFLTAGMIGAGVFIKSERDMLSRPYNNSAAKSYVSYLQEVDSLKEACTASEENVIIPEKSCIYGNHGAAKIAILGDSHAASLTTELGTALSANGVGLRRLAFLGCMPIRGLRRSDQSGQSQTQCPSYNDQVFRYLQEHQEIETVVLSSRWTFLLEGQRFDNGEGGHEIGSNKYVLPIESDNSFIWAPERMTVVSEAYANGIKSFLEMGKNVVLVYPIPEAGWYVPNYLAREAMYGSKRSQPLSTSFDVFSIRNRNTFAALDSVGTHPNLMRVYPSKILCDTYVKGRCILEKNGIPLYSDDDHLTGVGAKLVVEEIMKNIDLNYGQDLVFHVQ